MKEEARGARERVRRVRVVLLDFHDTLAGTPAYGFEARSSVLRDALARHGVELEAEAFAAAYREAERRARDKMQEGRELHNTFWVAEALKDLGRPHAPESPAVVGAVDAYFERFIEEIRLYEEVPSALARMAGSYRLGLLSNFTDPRPVRETLRRENLLRFFETLVISCEIGWRKPHRHIFETAVGELEVEPGEVLYVGDHPLSDVYGAREAGMLTCRVARPGQEPDWYLPWDRETQFEEADVVVEDLLELSHLLTGG